jgi:hypothetical protein
VAGLVDDEARSERRDCGVVGDWSDGTTRGANDVELFVALTRTTPDAARS